MLYQIKRCSAPCCGIVSHEDYLKLVKETVDFIEGRNKKLQDELARKMDEASANEDYETAIILRDRIKALTSVQQGNLVDYAKITSTDFIALWRIGSQACIQIFFVRGGQNMGNIPYFPKQTEDASDEEILEAFVSNFYVDHLAPKEIVTSKILPNKDLLQNAIHREK